MEAFTSKDITDFLKQFVAIGGGFYVDDNSIVRRVGSDGSDNIFCLQNNENPPRMVKVSVYDVNQQDPDTIMMNPFAGGLQTTDELRWFYTTRNICIASLTCKVINGIIRESLKAKDKEAVEQSTEITKLISPFIDDIQDLKIATEFALMYDNVTNFMNIYWDNKKNTCYLRIGVFEDSFKKTFGKRIRQKTWDVLAKIISAIFGTDDIKNTYTLKSSNQGFARIECYTQVFFMALKAIRPYLPLIEENIDIDYDAFEKHVSMIPLYYPRAKLMVSPGIKAPTTPTPANKVPWAPVPVSTMTPTSPVGTSPSVPVPGERQVVAVCQPKSVVQETAQPVHTTPTVVPAARAEYIPPQAMGYPQQQQVPPQYVPQPPMYVPMQGQGQGPPMGYPQQMPIQAAPLSVGHLAAAMPPPMMGGYPQQMMGMQPNPFLVQQPQAYPQQAVAAPGMMVPAGYNQYPQGMYPQQQQQVMYQQTPQGMVMVGYPNQQPMPGFAPMMGQQPYQQPPQAFVQNVGGLPMMIGADPRANRAESPI